jgi:hypothetical protein
MLKAFLRLALPYYDPNAHTQQPDKTPTLLIGYGGCCNLIIFSILRISSTASDHIFGLESTKKPTLFAYFCKPIYFMGFPWLFFP